MRTYFCIAAKKTYMDVYSWKVHGDCALALVLFFCVPNVWKRFCKEWQNPRRVPLVLPCFWKSIMVVENEGMIITHVHGCLHEITTSWAQLEGDLIHRPEINLHSRPFPSPAETGFKTGPSVWKRKSRLNCLLILPKELDLSDTGHWVQYVHPHCSYINRFQILWWREQMR